MLVAAEGQREALDEVEVLAAVPGAHVVGLEQKVEDTKERLPDPRRAGALGPLQMRLQQAFSAIRMGRRYDSLTLLGIRRRTVGVGK